MRPSRFVIVPSFSIAEVAGRMTCAQSAVGVGKSELATTDSQRCRAASQRSASGKRESGSASPSTTSICSVPSSARAQHVGGVVAVAERVQAALVRALGHGEHAARAAGEAGGVRDRGGGRHRGGLGRDQDGMRGGPQLGLDLAGGDVTGGDVVEVAAAAAGEQQARAAAHGLAHAQLEHAGGVAELALAGDDDQVGAVEVGDARRVRRERVPVAAAREAARDERPAAGRAHELGPGVGLLVALLARGHDGDRLGAVEARVVAQAPRDRLRRAASGVAGSRPARSAHEARRR